MNIIAIWPYELKVSNRAHYPRFKALLGNFKVTLVTVDKEFIGMDLIDKFWQIFCTPVSGKLSILFYPLTILCAVLKSKIKKEKVLLYVFYNSNIFPAMIVSLLTGSKIFVDFLDDPNLSTEILKVEKRKKMKWLAYKIINWLFLLFATKTDKIVGYSAIGLSETSKLPQLYLKRYAIEFHKLISVSNGVDLSITYPLNQNESREITKETPLRLVYVGIVSPRRETNILVENLVKIKDFLWELVLIGETITAEDKNRIDQIINQYPRVFYKGPLPHKKVLEWIDRGDAGIFMASKKVTNYRYTHPIKVIEYLAMGKPVIAPRFSGVKELVKEGYNGFLFDPDHPEELIEIITKHHEDLKGGKFRGNALESAKKFDWSVIHEKFMIDFKRILDTYL